MMRKKIRKPRQCRFEPLEPRRAMIVGGVPTSTEVFPFAVALQSAGLQLCGGSLIDERHVLTAAHCTNFTGIEAIVNRTDLRTTAGEAIPVVAIENHPKFDRRTLDNDLAILTLARPVANAQPIRPAKHGELNSPGNMATVVGWGARKFNSSGTNVLHRVNVPIVSNAQANRPEGYQGDVTGNMLAAGAAGKDSCQGDSGGPLFVRNSVGELRQVGIVSWGIGCGWQNKPGIYTRVSNYFDWISRQSRESLVDSGYGVTNSLARSIDHDSGATSQEVAAIAGLVNSLQPQMLPRGPEKEYRSPVVGSGTSHVATGSTGWTESVDHLYQASDSTWSSIRADHDDGIPSFEPIPNLKEAYDLEDLIDSLA